MLSLLRVTEQMAHRNFHSRGRKRQPSENQQRGFHRLHESQILPHCSHIVKYSMVVLVTAKETLPYTYNCKLDQAKPSRNNGEAEQATHPDNHPFLLYLFN